MPLMVWNDRLSVGIEAIDRDHRKLVMLMNALYDAVNAGSGKDLIVPLMDELVAYCEYHFSHEEALFSRFNYPEALEHAFEHAAMAEWCEKTQSDLRDQRLPAPSLHVITYLKDWVFDHIMGSDRRFGVYLAKTGQQPIR